MTTAPQSSRPVRPRATWLRLLGLACFPLIVWLAATLFAGGNLGKVTDDYSLNERDVRTEALAFPFNPYRRYSYFWRPLHVLFAYSVGTILWEHDRLIHIGCALVHGTVGLLLWRLLRKSGAGELASVAAATLYTVYPTHYEVMFWFSSCSTAVSAALLLCLLTWMIADAREATSAVTNRGLPKLAGMAILAAAAICFYEQSGTAALIVPLIYIAARPSGFAIRDGIRRSLAPTAVLLALDVTYFLLLRETAPPGARGGEGTLVAASSVLERVFELGASIWSLLGGARASHIVLGGFREGWPALVQWSAWPWLVSLVAGALVWTAAWAAPKTADTREPASSDQEFAATSPRHLRWVLCGLVLFIAGWLPLALLSRQNVETRTGYIPLLGLAMAAAHTLTARRAEFAGKDSVRRAVGAFRPALAAVVALLAIFGVVIAIGFQRWFIARHGADVSIVQQLTALVPSPPTGAVFMPLRLKGCATSTGYALFDRAMPGAFETYWSAQAVIQRAYRRDDIGSTFSNTWSPPPLDDATAADIRHTTGLVDLFRPPVVPADAGHWVHRIRWELAIPFIVDEQGRVRRVTSLFVERPDGRDLRIEPPMTQGAAGTPGFEPATIGLPDDSPLTIWQPRRPHGWAWSANGGPVDFTTAAAWGSQRRAVWLHPGAEGGRRAGARVKLPELPKATAIVFRFTIAEHDLQLHAEGASMVLEVRTSRGVVLGTAEVSRAGVTAQSRWLPLRIELPPMPADSELFVSVRPAPGAASNAWFDPVWMTPGIIAGDAE